jgi:drug/metabolite transporter (DMT)-like permease
MDVRLFSLCAGAVLSGTTAVLSLKAMYQTKTTTGGTFDKPFTTTLVIAAAMSMSLVCWLCLAKYSKENTKKPGKGKEPCVEEVLLATSDEVLVLGFTTDVAKIDFSCWDALVLILCGSSDLICGVCDTVSLNLAPASIISLIGSSNIVFCAITTRLLLGTTYTTRQYVGIVLGLAGLICVAFAALESDRDSAQAGETSHIALGVGITVFARLLQSIQVTLEEKFMKAGRFSPLQQVGWEGVVEVVLLVAVVLPVVNSLPGSDNGRLEDVGEALVDISHSTTLGLLCALSFASLALLNPISMAIGLAHGSVLRVSIFKCSQCKHLPPSVFTVNIFLHV